MAVDEQIRILSPEELEPKKGVKFSRSWLWKMEKNGQWPKRVRIGGKKFGWIESEIDAHLRKLAAVRA